MSQFMPAGGGESVLGLQGAFEEAADRAATLYRETEAYLSEHNDLKGLYDDDRSIRVEQSINGELSIKLGNQEPIHVFAEDFRRLVSEQAELSLGALPGHVTPDRETEIRQTLSAATELGAGEDEWCKPGCPVGEADKAATETRKPAPGDEAGTRTEGQHG